MSVYYDAGFKPRLNQFTPYDHEKYFDNWKMQSTAEPIPSERQLRTAVWFGQRLNKYMEFPVIAVAIEPEIRLSIANAEWYCGVASENEVRGSDNPLLSILDAASTLVPNPNDAVINLNILLPITSYGPNIELDLPAYLSQPI